MPQLYLGPVWFVNFQGFSPFATHLFRNTIEFNHSISFHLISDIISLVMALATLCCQKNGLKSPCGFPTKAGEINKSLSQLALVIQRLTSTGSADDPVMKRNLVDSSCFFL